MTRPGEDLLVQEKWDLGFATPWSFREDSQRVGGLCTSFLLKLGNPIGYCLYHFTRRFTSGIDFGTGIYWALLLALLDNSNCFFLRHLFILNFVFLPVSNEILAIQFPNSYLERQLRSSLAKVRPKNPTMPSQVKYATIAGSPGFVRTRNALEFARKRYTARDLLVFTETVRDRKLLFR